jgi:response regulator RpfG family c-di-GMP phosphodiesterase
MTPYTPETILIVDDSPDNLIILSKIRKPFYKVKVADNGTI